MEYRRSARGLTAVDENARVTATGPVKRAAPVEPVDKPGLRTKGLTVRQPTSSVEQPPAKKAKRASLVGEEVVVRAANGETSKECEMVTQDFTCDIQYDYAQDAPSGSQPTHRPAHRSIPPPVVVKGQTMQDLRKAHEEHHRRLREAHNRGRRRSRSLSPRRDGRRRESSRDRRDNREAKQQHDRDRFKAQQRDERCEDSEEEDGDSNEARGEGRLRTIGFHPARTAPARKNSDWMYDSYQDHSDLSELIATPHDSSEEEEESGDGRAGSSAGSGSTAALVDCKENRTPVEDSTPASRLSSTNRMSKQKGKTINISALIDRNKQLEYRVFDLRSKISALNKDLPWLMIKGVDHLANYIQLRSDVMELRTQQADYEGNMERLKEAHRVMMEQERERLQQQHMNEMDRMQQQLQLHDRMAQDYGDAMDRSMMSDDECSLWSEGSRVRGWMEDKITILERDLKAAKDAVEKERATAASAQKALGDVRAKMEEAEREWARREASLASMEQIGRQRSQIDELKKEVAELKRTKKREATCIKGRETVESLGQPVMPKKESRSFLPAGMRPSPIFALRPVERQLKEEEEEKKKKVKKRVTWADAVSEEEDEADRAFVQSEEEE